MGKRQSKVGAVLKKERDALVDAVADMIRRSSEEGQLLSEAEIVHRLVDQYLAPNCLPSPLVAEGEGDTNAHPTVNPVHPGVNSFHETQMMNRLWLCWNGLEQNERNAKRKRNARVRKVEGRLDRPYALRYVLI